MLACHGMYSSSSVYHKRMFKIYGAAARPTSSLRPQYRIWGVHNMGVGGTRFDSVGSRSWAQRKASMCPIYGIHAATTTTKPPTTASSAGAFVNMSQTGRWSPIAATNTNHTRVMNNACTRCVCEYRLRILYLRGGKRVSTYTLFFYALHKHKTYSPTLQSF